MLGFDLIGWIGQILGHFMLNDHNVYDSCVVMLAWCRT